MVAVANSPLLPLSTETAPDSILPSVKGHEAARYDRNQNHNHSTKKGDEKNARSAIFSRRLKVPFKKLRSGCAAAYQRAMRQSTLEMRDWDLQSFPQGTP